MKRLNKIQVIVLLLVGMFIGGLAVKQLDWLPDSHAEWISESSSSSGLNSSPRLDADLIKNMNSAFIQIAEQANKSVVTIFTDKVVKTRGVKPFASPFSDDPFRDFFGDDFFSRFFRPRVPEGEQHLRGMGSGVIVSTDGYILTNNHVVKDADKVRVMFLGGKKVDAKIIGTDAKTDIAVLKVDEKNLTPLELGDSDQLKVGEWVVAVGSPLSENLAHTVTAGIVSAKGRSNLQLADYEDFIQTDAAINPGNSGGALINLEGKLVGINTAIATQSGGFQGIGFAVPINMARAVMDALITSGKVVRGWLGVYIQDVDDAMAEAMGLPATGGALISDVVKDGPGAKAGLQAGDVVVKLDDTEVKSSTHLRNEIARRTPASKVELLINRRGKEKTVTVKLGELPEQAPATEVKQGIIEKLGFSVRALDDQRAQRFGFNPDEQGVVITEIRSGSAAFRAGLRQGDLIKEINRKPVTSVRQFSEIVAKLNSGEKVLIYVKRGSNSFFVAFEVQ
ncbi:MAG: DegQ family serine endoprotease [bacterium]